MGTTNQQNNSNESNPRKQIDFIGIFKRAAGIFYENRFLFWFGVLIALGSPAGFNLSSSSDNIASNESAKNFLTEHWQFAIVLAILLFVLAVAIFLVSLIAKAGLIKSVHLITLEKETIFKKGWKQGKKYLFKLFKLFLIFFFATLVLFLVLAIPVIYFLANHLWVEALLVGLLAIAILIPIIFILAFTNIFAEFYIVLSDLRVWSAVEAGYNLFLKNLGNSLIFALLFLVVDIIFGIIMLPVAGIMLVVLIPAGILFYSLNKIFFGIYLALALFGAIVIILFFSAIFAVFKTTAWTLFFKEIAEIKKEEAEKVAEEEKIQEISAIGEKA